MRYPQSFLKLLLVAFSLVALPLAFALVTSAIAVDRLANRSQSAVYQAVQATQSSRRLSEVLTAMERSARQIVILNDRGLLDAYKISRAQFEEVAAQFSDLPFDAGQRAELDEIIATERQIFDALSNTRLKPAELATQVRRFVAMAGHAQSIMVKSAGLIDREVESMRNTAAEAQRIMLWQALALIPVMIFLFIGFIVLISRPIRQLDSAIRQLGDGKFQTPVVVNGPADLEYLGGRLEWMRRQLIDLEQQKNRFLQQISHDLKTPLTALREGAQLLSDDVVGRLTPEQREIAQILRHNSLELQARIEELLDYGALQFMKRKLELAPLSPRLILEQVAQRQKLALQAKNLAFKVQAVDLTIVADADKMRIVVDNLLSNAIRFSPVGGAITMCMSEEAGNLVLDVTDEGPGIAAADQPHIFEPFYQGRTRGSGPVKGTGLGLSIARECVMEHGGNIEVVATAAPRGAHLRVRLPLKPAEAN
jgi:two-component system, NtrC family, sensor histidine kinase GlrK